MNPQQRHAYLNPVTRYSKWSYKLVNHAVENRFGLVLSSWVELRGSLMDEPPKWAAFVMLFDGANQPVSLTSLTGEQLASVYGFAEYLLDGVGEGEVTFQPTELSPENRSFHAFKALTKEEFEGLPREAKPQADDIMWLAHEDSELD